MIGNVEFAQIPYLNLNYFAKFFVVISTVRPSSSISAEIAFRTNKYSIMVNK